MVRRLLDRWNHEYWPWYVIYLPLLPFYLVQAIRQRRAAFFTNVNPALSMGGFFGESKSEIYALLPVESYPQTIVLMPDTAMEQVLQIHQASGIGYPFIAKPDVGERGDGVQLVADEHGLLDACADRPRAMLMQALAQGEHEFGLLFMRDPDTGRTTLLSITGKRFLSVTGDGRGTVRDLLARTWRGRKQLDRIDAEPGDRLSLVPASGEEVMVEPIGNHCRGTVFFDANHLATDKLREHLHELLSGTSGIHFGRFDVRSSSEDALRNGRFTVIEMNGVMSEPGHIYDPSYSIFRCWREMLRNTRHIGRLSAHLQRGGHEPTTFHEVIVRCEEHFDWRLGLAGRMLAGRATRQRNQTSVRQGAHLLDPR